MNLVYINPTCGWDRVFLLLLYPYPWNTHECRLSQRIHKWSANLFLVSTRHGVISPWLDHHKIYTSPTPCPRRLLCLYADRTLLPLCWCSLEMQQRCHPSLSMCPAGSCFDKLETQKLGAPYTSTQYRGHGLVLNFYQAKLPISPVNAQRYLNRFSIYPITWRNCLCPRVDRCIRQMYLLWLACSNSKPHVATTSRLVMTTPPHDMYISPIKFLKPLLVMLSFDVPIIFDTHLGPCSSQHTWIM